MKEEKKLVPKRRFKGFEDHGEWWEKKLENIAETYSGGTPSVTNKAFYNGPIPFIRSGEIDLSLTSLSITVEGLQKSSARLVEKGDILYALYGATSGEVSISKIQGAINQAILAIKPQQNYDKYYLLYWFKKHKVNIINSQLQGGQGNLSGEIIRNLLIDSPNKEEQQKIGQFFKVLDNRIANQERKIAKIKALKSAYLTKMFPQEGEIVPKRRFVGFTNEWKEQELGQLGEILTGNTPSTSDKSNWEYNKKGYVWITPTDIHSLTTSSSERYLSDIGWEKARRLPPNSVLITSIASIGKNTINTIPAAFNQQINAIIPEDNDPYFILTMMEKEKDRFSSIAGHTATAIINKTEFEKFKVIVPELKEQQKIGQFFKNLDDQIATEERKLAKLKAMKEAYLEEMFV